MRRRIGVAVDSVAGEPAADTHDAAPEEATPQLLQVLAAELKRRNIGIRRIRTAPGGFFVTPDAGTSSDEQWFSTTQIRELQTEAGMPTHTRPEAAPSA